MKLIPIGFFIYIYKTDRGGRWTQFIYEKWLIFATNVEGLAIL